ncbi:glycosyltransferase family 4 protein [Paraburkholderia terricola]|uniref:glycosyltransferase family 4 protein n=1 Tax=Paraburkholderia terricola TaxID=169427 RepID=UPI001FD0D6DF|nr:glycosyltransferase family 4 protein [Paraburkholderia terricola]
MNIVLLVSSMGTGGAERVASTLVNAWARRGDTVTLVITYSGRGSCFYTLRSQVRLVYLADLAGRKRSGLRGYAARLRALRTLLCDSKPDVVISFLTNVNISAILASRGLRVPVIVCEHNDPAADGRSRLWRLACRFLYPRASLAAVLTENVVAPFRQMVPRMARVAVMPNPLPDELFDRADLGGRARERGVTAHGDGRRRLISVGRLHEQKQYDLLITVFGSLADAFPEWDLWIWGDGPERARLEAQVADAALKERVFLPGKTVDPWAEMARSDVFVLSSRFEGLPMALMEAMGVGMATIAFDCRSGPRELMRAGSDGWLVPPGDAYGMEQGLRRLFADDALRAELGCRAAHSIRERFSAQAVLDMWDAQFERVGARPRRAGAAVSAAMPAVPPDSSCGDIRQPARQPARHPALVDIRRVDKEPT